MDFAHPTPNFVVNRARFANGGDFQSRATRQVDRRGLPRPIADVGGIARGRTVPRSVPDLVIIEPL